jgi:alpha-N-arabinofuranosidase
VDPERAAQIEVAVGGALTGASGETLTAPRVDSINTFEAPDTVVPKPLQATVRDGRLQLQLEPRSVSVLVLQQ